MPDAYTPQEQQLADRWQTHMDCEFVRKDAAATVGTMTAAAYCNHGPVLTGGTGADQMLAFYRDHFISRIPADLEMELITRTVGQNRVIDEHVIRFTHDIEMDWMLPGVPPNRTARRGGVRRNRPVRCRRQGCARAHLLGSSHGAHAARAH